MRGVQPAPWTFFIVCFAVPWAACSLRRRGIPPTSTGLVSISNPPIYLYTNLSRTPIKTVELTLLLPPASGSSQLTTHLRPRQAVERRRGAIKWKLLLTPVEDYKRSRG